MKFLRHGNILLLLLLLIGSCRSRQEMAGKIVIISTNDMHARIDRFPQLATLVEQKKSEGGEVILVDAGDRFSGNPYVDNVAEKGAPMIRLMNQLGYEVAAMGNHDFDYGQKVLKKRLREAKFPVICANMISAESELGALKPYQIIEKGGHKLCFFSLIQTGSQHIPATNPANLGDISFRYYKDVVPEYKRLASECDVMIGLTHLGFANDSLLALVMPELDVIVGGHSHTVLREPKLVNGVLISQAGSNQYYAGVTTLQFKGKKLIGKTYSLVPLNKTGEKDPEIEMMVEEIINYPKFREVIGHSAIDMKEKEDIASLMTDAMCSAVDGDFAFYNKGGVRMNQLQKGDITREMVYRMEPFSNYIVTHNWNLEQIKKFLLTDYNRIPDPQKRYLNYFISAGKYEIIRNKQGEGVEVNIYDSAGHLLKDSAKKYKIAFSNYITSSNKTAPQGTDSGILISDAIVEYLQKQEGIAYKGQRAFVK